MNLEKYPVQSEHNMKEHEFFSEGPKGRIKKIIRFQDMGANFYNLAFGDEREDGRLDVAVRSNNNDVDKILATVGSVVVNFMQVYPLATVVAEGNMEAKTRLYRMKLNKHLIVIRSLFTLQGWYQYGWESFRSDRNYDAVALKSKGEK